MGREHQDIYPAAWFPLTVPSREPEPTAEQWAFLEEARGLFTSLNPIRAASTWAVLWGGMVLVIPLQRRRGIETEDRGSLHTSLQLLMGERRGSQVIVGAWQDAHYIWDYEPKRPDFEVRGHDRDARAKALDWLAYEMRRPIVRTDAKVLGMTIGSVWRYTDGDRAVIESRGLFPLVWAFGGKHGVAAGYFDAW